MVIVKASEDTEKGVPPTQEAMAAMQAYGEAMAEAGVLTVEGAGLMTSAHGKRLVFEGSAARVIDGPFAETRELVAGYCVWEVKDMEEALVWAQRWPNPPSMRTEIELRPLFLWEAKEETFAEAGL
jgi:hypothetical protein